MSKQFEVSQCWGAKGLKYTAHRDHGDYRTFATKDEAQSYANLRNEGKTDKEAREILTALPAARMKTHGNPSR